MKILPRSHDYPIASGDPWKLLTCAEGVPEEKWKRSVERALGTNHVTASAAQMAIRSVIRPSVPCNVVRRRVIGCHWMTVLSSTSHLQPRPVPLFVDGGVGCIPISNVNILTYTVQLRGNSGLQTTGNLKKSVWTSSFKLQASSLYFFFGLGLETAIDVDHGAVCAVGVWYMIVRLSASTSTHANE